MAGIPAFVEDRFLDPAEIGAKSDTPNDGRDVAALQVEAVRDIGRRLPNRYIPCFLGCFEVVLGNELVDAVLDVLGDGIGMVQIAGQPSAKLGDPANDVFEAAIQLHAFERELAQIDVASAITPGHIVIGFFPHAGA